MSSRFARLAATAVIVGVALSGIPVEAVAAGFQIDDRSVSEPVGLALAPGGERYWTVNRSESGGETKLYSLRSDGRTARKVSVAANARSVEALAVADGHLYFGDIGSKDGSREKVSVVRVNDLGLERSTYRSWDLQYPDGGHDAKAMLVTDAGRFFVITSGEHPGVYRSAAQPSRQAVNKLTRVADVPPGVTDAVLVGDSAVLRTTRAVLVYKLSDWSLTASAPLTTGLDGEMMAKAASGKGVAVGGAGPGAKVDTVALPTKIEPIAVPGQEASPEPSPPASSPPASQPQSTPPSQPPASKAPADQSKKGSGESVELGPLPAPGNHGTLAAIAAALALAVLAGAVVFLRR